MSRRGPWGSVNEAWSSMKLKAIASKVRPWAASTHILRCRSPTTRALRMDSRGRQAIAVQVMELKPSVREAAPEPQGGPEAHERAERRERNVFELLRSGILRRAIELARDIQYGPHILPRDPASRNEHGPAKTVGHGRVSYPVQTLRRHSICPPPN